MVRVLFFCNFINKLQKTYQIELIVKKFIKKLINYISSGKVKTDLISRLTKKISLHQMNY